MNILGGITMAEILHTARLIEIMLAYLSRVSLDTDTAMMHRKKMIGKTSAVLIFLSLIS